GRFTGWEVGPDRDVLPGIEVLAQGVELLARHPQRVLAEEQMERGVRRFDRLDDRVRCADGVARLLAVQLAQLAADGAGGRGVVGDPDRSLVRGPAGPVGAEAARLDKRDLDPQWPDFHGQALGQTLDGELGPAVVAEAWERRQPGNRGNVDDVAAAVPPPSPPDPPPPPTPPHTPAISHPPSL